VIEDPAVAKSVNGLLLEINGRLNESISNVEQNCSPAEFALYRRRVGKIIDAIFEVILEPIYSQHPTLKPPDLE
jgi:hypothetical protein